MGYSVKILECNGHCRSCYENSIRSRGVPTYDIDKVASALEKCVSESESGRNVPCLHGGEPLIIGKHNVERLFKIVFDKYKKTSIQTNGLLIDDEYIELFKKYNTSVGISIDGDTAELNMGRWNDSNFSLEEIQKKTDLVIENLRRCREAGLSVSVISVLRKYNASLSRIPRFIRFLNRLKDEFGVVWVRTNEGIVFNDKFRKEEQLTVDELTYAFISLASVCLSDSQLMWAPYRDVVDALIGSKNVVCVLTECDVWHTTSEEPIDGNGNIGNCLKGGGAVDGFQVLRADGIGFERYNALFQIPFEKGGCGGCRYWKVCYGGCPGEGKDNDWRNKTRFCMAWYRLFSFTEKWLKGVFPNIYLVPDGSVGLGQAFVDIVNGSSYALSARTEKAKKNENAEYGEVCGHADRHGDAPHGDHTDQSWRV